jgi:hypothetical protein
VRALYTYAGAGLALTAGLVLVVATRSLNPGTPAASPPAAADDGLDQLPPAPLPAPVRAPVEQGPSFTYSGRIPHFAIKADWKELAEALPAGADATSYYLSPINPPTAQTGDAMDAAAHPVALAVDIGDEAPPEATGDTRIGD